MNGPASNEFSVVDLVVAAIRDGVSRGEYVPGQRLPEVDLVASLGASRGSVREALRRLTAEGLVQVTANRGASVRRLSRREVVDLFQIRGRLEPLAACLAAERIKAGTADLALLKALKVNVDASARYRSIHAANEYGALNREFHRLVVALSGNMELDRIVGQLHIPVFSQQFRWFLDVQGQVASLADHREIYDAIAGGSAQRAEAATAEHVNVGLAVAMALPDKCFS